MPLALSATLLVVAGSGVPGEDRAARRREAPEGLHTATVRRSAIESRITLGGEVGSAKFTLIVCELENVFGASSAMTIIEVVPEGSTVKKGDMIARFDASAYEERARQVELDLGWARSERRKAELDLKAAEAGLREFLLGQATVQEEDFRTQISLAESDASRREARLEWSRQMRDVGYISRAEFAEEDRAAVKARIDLKRLNGQYANFRRFTVPRTTLELEAGVSRARALLNYANLALTNQESRLKSARKRVEDCTVRAPHDGFVIYWDITWGDMQPIREGAQVHQGQPMFTLPDLKQLNVEVSVHESIIDRVKVGMPARVRIDARPDRTFRGHVATIAQLPDVNWRVGIDVKHFVAQVRLDEQPEGVLPNMSASAEVVGARREGALVVPPEAITVEDHRAFCDVVGPDGPARRPIKLGLATRDAVEIVEGLREGEQVVLHLSEVERIDGSSNAFLPPFNGP